MLRLLPISLVIPSLLSLPTKRLSEAPHLNIYLKEFGWIPKNSEQDLPFEAFRDALSNFQQFANIPQTGILDSTTVDTMRRPRCGVLDRDTGEDEQFGRPPVKSRTKRYAIEGSYWGVKNITYKISKYTEGMKDRDIDHVIEKSFKVWENHTPLRFERKKPDEEVHIDVQFAQGSHGDGENFDGRGQILAHAFFPRYGGDVHFDEEEPWVTPNAAGVDLFSVATHEIGHSLGLKHSDNHQALMAPFYKMDPDGMITLTSDDIEAIQHLYGKKSSKTAQPQETKPISVPDVVTAEPTLQRSSDDSSTSSNGTLNICNDATIDAITVIGNGSTYAFKGDWYWRLNEVSFDSGFPRRIEDDWSGLPGHIGAAVTDYDGDTYFFKGDKYWLYGPDGNPYTGYPRVISNGLVDMPNDIDAGMIWSYDNKPYFFKGKKFWQYSRWGMPSSWPRNVTQIDDNLPASIDAALKWTNGKSYIFTGHQYYRVSGWRRLKTTSGYPRDIGEWWFGCAPVTNSSGPRSKREQTRRRSR